MDTNKIHLRLGPAFQSQMDEIKIPGSQKAFLNRIFSFSNL